MRLHPFALPLVIAGCFSDTPLDSDPVDGSTSTSETDPSASTSMSTSMSTATSMPTSSTATTGMTTAATETTTSEGAGDWWDPAWSRRRPLAFNNGGPDEGVDDVPILVLLTSARIDFGVTQPRGEDVRFVVDGEPVPHELERWDDAAAAWFWVRMPSLDLVAGDDTIYMYYGNDAAQQESAPEEVWANGYASVLHFSDDIDAGTTTLSASVGPDAVLVGGVSPFTGADGTAGGCVDFVLGEGYATIDGIATDDWPEVSVTLWGTRTGGGRVLCKSMGPMLENSVFCLAVNAASIGHTIHTDVTVGDQSFYQDLDPGNRPFFAATTWSAEGGVSTGVFGTEVTYDNRPGAGLKSGPDVVTIGAASAGGGTLFAGCIDEVRIADVWRSEAWLEIQRLSFEDALISYGPEETAP